MSVQIKNKTTGNWEKAALGAKEVQDQIGDLTNLNTTAKTNLVAAINEAAQSGGSGGSGGSTTTPIMQGATASTDGMAGSAPKPFIADRSKALFGDAKYHFVSTGTNSTVIAYIPDTSFVGETVTLTDGSTTLTGTIDASGEYAFTNLTLWGPVSLYCTHDDVTVRGFACLTTYGNYLVYLTTDVATITVTTDDSTLYGKTVQVLDGSISGELLYTGVFDNTGTCVIYVDKLKQFCVKAYNTAGKLCHNYVTPNAFGANFNVLIGPYVVYGFSVNLNTADPEQACSVPEDCDNYGYTPARMNYATGKFDYGSWTGHEFFFPKPCMLNFDGIVAYYLDPNDYTKKADGTASDIADTSTSLNAMMEFPTIYFKRETNTTTGIVTVHLSDHQLDADYHAYAHHDKSGNVLENIYMACYDMSVTSNKGRSLSGQSLYNNHTRQEEATAAQNCNTNGETGEGWYTWHKADWDMVRDLAILISGTLDSQTAFGAGCCGGSGESDQIGTTGSLNDKGLFFGYDYSFDSLSSVKIFGIENFYGNMFKCVAGWNTLSGKLMIKMTYGTEDGSSVLGYNFDGSGYNQFSTSYQQSNGNTKKWYATDLGYIPWTSGGSDTTYTCDYMWYAANSYARVGGRANSGLLAGMSFVVLDSSASDAYWNNGAALTYKGIVS